LVPLVSARPLRALLPLDDPFGELGQVCTGSDEQCGLERLGLPLVRVFTGVEAECDPGPRGQQVAAAVGNLSQLGDRGLEVCGSRSGQQSGELRRSDPVRVGFAAGDGHRRLLGSSSTSFPH
jgi:hypothetical protein